MNAIWEILVRWRTYLVNIVLALLLVAPELLNSPQVLAVVPAEYQRWFLVAAFLTNIWMRPRPAVMAKDPEAEVTRLRKAGLDFRGTDLP